MDNQPTTASPLQIMNGGVEIKVRHNDGTEETIKVRQLPMRHISKYGNAQGDEGALIELFTDKPPEWVDALTQESQEEIVVIGDRLNLDPFFRWSERRLKANNRLEPLTKLISPLVKSAPPSAPGAGTPPSSS